MSDPPDPAFGVKAFSIAGRMRLVRERAKGMTDTERQWRAQWLKDQELSPEEPVNVPEFYKATNNIFRRLYKDPMNAFQKMLEPSLGHRVAFNVRHTISKSLMCLYTAWFGYYIYKYYSNDFTRFQTIEVWNRRKRSWPDDPDYPNIPVLRDRDYYDLGFYSSPLCVDIEYIPPTPPPPPSPSPAPPTLEEESSIICPPPETEYYEP